MVYVDNLCELIKLIIDNNKRLPQIGAFIIEESVVTLAPSGRELAVGYYGFRQTEGERVTYDLAYVISLRHFLLFVFKALSIDYTLYNAGLLSSRRSDTPSHLPPGWRLITERSFILEFFVSAYHSQLIIPPLRRYRG